MCILLGHDHDYEPLSPNSKQCTWSQTVLITLRSLSLKNKNRLWMHMYSPFCLSVPVLIELWSQSAPTFYFIMAEHQKRKGPFESLGAQKEGSLYFLFLSCEAWGHQRDHKGDYMHVYTTHEVRTSNLTFPVECFNRCRETSVSHYNHCYCCFFKYSDRYMNIHIQQKSSLIHVKGEL